MSFWVGEYKTFLWENLSIFTKSWYASFQRIIWPLKEKLWRHSGLKHLWYVTKKNFWMFFYCCCYFGSVFIVLGGEGLQIVPLKNVLLFTYWEQFAKPKKISTPQYSTYFGAWNFVKQSGKHSGAAHSWHHLVTRRNFFARSFFGHFS